jgi:hypothetical protein
MIFIKTGKQIARFSQLLLAAVLCGPAFAQNDTVVPETPLTFSSYFGVTNDSNLLRSANNEVRDTIYAAGAGVRFDQLFSLQRIKLGLNLSTTKYAKSSEFDSNNYAGQASWDWQYGRNWFGQAGVAVNKTATSFSDQLSVKVNNQVTTQALDLSAGYYVVPGLALFSGASSLKANNSAGIYESQDFKASSFSVGGRYAVSPKTYYSIGFKRSSGSFPKQRVFDPVTGFLASFSDNGYKEDNFFVQGQFNPNDLSVFGGEIAFTARDYDNLGERNFSGLTWNLSYSWYLSDRFTTRFSIGRSLGANQTIFNNYVVTDGVSISPIYNLSDKTKLSAVIEQRRSDFSGDPGFVLQRTVARNTVFRQYGLNFDYSATRTITLQSKLSRQSRSANSESEKYSATVFGITGLLQF